MSFEKMISDHVRLRSIVAQFQILLDNTLPPNGDELAAVRWEVGRLVMQNLAYEERHIYSRYSRSNDAAAMVILSKSAYGLRSLFTDYQSHVDRFTAERVRVDWHAYRVSAAGLLAKLLDRMTWEERELFPRVTNGLFAFGETASIDHNWARHAFSIKASIRAGLQTDRGPYTSVRRPQDSGK